MAPTMTDRPQAVHYRARIHEVTANGYRVRLSELAPGRLWGPVASAIPNLAVGDTVVVSQVGVSRDNLVILARIPGLSVQVADNPGLRSELDVLAADLATVDARMTVAETDIDTAAGQRAGLRGDIDANTLRLDAHDGTLSGLDTQVAGLDGRVDALETAPEPVLPWTDEHDYGDVAGTVPRAGVNAALGIDPGQTLYTRLTVREAITTSELRIALSGGTSDTVQLSLWFGPDPAALPLAYSDTQGVPFGTAVVTVPGQLPLNARDTLVLGLGRDPVATTSVNMLGVSVYGQVASTGTLGALWWSGSEGITAVNPLAVPAQGPSGGSAVPWLAIA